MEDEKPDPIIDTGQILNRQSRIQATEKFSEHVRSAVVNAQKVGEVGGLRKYRELSLK
jgi:hypothetical protein